MQAAIPFIQILDDGSFLVNPDTESILRSISTPISVVTTIGTCNSGKSALLNFLHAGKAAFKTGDSAHVSRSTTKGIWMWITSAKSKGQDITLITLDTEGLYAQGQEGKHDALIFSLSILFSTVLIFNSLPGILDDNSMSTLALMNRIPDVVKHLPGLNNPDDFDENIFRKLTPSFCWLLRDFEKSLVDTNGLEITPLQYMEEYLQSKSGYDRRSLECTRLRKILTTLFPDRMCKVLARPIFDEVSIKHIGRCPPNMLRQEFLANLDDFQKYILNNLELKVYDGKRLSGHVFAQFAVQCVRSINNSGTIMLEDSWAMLSKSVCEQAVSDQVRRYAQSMAVACLGVNTDEFEALHDKAMHESLHAFDANTLGRFSADARVELHARIMVERKRCMDINYLASQSHCEQVARELFQSILRPQLYPDSGPSPYEADSQVLKDDWARFHQAYSQKAVGPAAGNVYSETTINRMVESISSVTKSMRDRYESQIKVQQVLMQNLETKLASKIVDEHALRNLSSSTTSKVELLEARVVELSNANKEYLLRLDDLDALKGMADRELARTRDVKDRLEEKLVDQRAKLLSKSNAYDEAKRQLTDLGVQVQSLQRKLDQEVIEKRAMKQELDTTTDKLLKMESMSFGKSGSGEALDSFTVMQSQINNLQANLRAINTDKIQMEIQLRSERESLAQSMERMEESSRSRIAELTEEISYLRSEIASKDKLMNSSEDTIRQLQTNVRELSSRCLTAEHVQGTMMRAGGLSSEDISRENMQSKQHMEEILSEHRRLVEAKTKELMSMSSAQDMLKKELASVQRELASAAETKRLLIDEQVREKDRLASELQTLQQKYDAQARQNEVIVQTQRANLHSSGSTVSQLESKIADHLKLIGELEETKQVQTITLEELSRAKRECDEQLIREKAAKQQLEKRLNDGLSSLDTTSRSFQELQYAYETLLSESSAHKAQIEKQKLIAANATTVAEKASADVAEAVRAISGYVSEIEGHVANIKRLEGVIADKNRDMETLAEVIKAHQLTISEKDAKIDSLMANISDLRAMGQRDSTTTSTLASKIQQQEHQIFDLQAELKLARNQTEEAHSDMSAMQTELEGEREERLLLEQYLASAREKLDVKAVDHDRTLKDVNDRASEALIAQRVEFENQIKRIEESARLTQDTLQGELNNLSARHDELNRVHKDLQRDLQQTITARDGIQAELLQTKVSLEKANRELVQSYEEAIGSLKGSGQELNNRLATLTSELQQARAETQDVRNASRLEKQAIDENHRDEKTALQNTIALLEKEGRKQEQHVQMQALKIEALDQAIAEQKRAIGLLEASLAQRENMIQTRENTIQTRETTIHGLESKIESLERYKLELTGNCQSLQLKLDDAQAKIRDIERTLERERDVRSRGEERFEELKRTYEDRLEDARVQATQKQQQFDSKMSDKIAEFEAQRLRVNEDFTQRLNDLTSQLTAKSDELHITKRELNSAANEKNRLEELYRVYRERTEDVSRETSLSFEATSQALVAKVKNLEENVMELSSTLRARNAHIDDLEATKKQLEEELAIVTRMRQRADEKIEVQSQRIELLESAKMNLMAEIQQKTIRSESHESVRKQLETQVANMAQDMQRMDRTLLEKMNQIEALKKTVASHESLIDETESRLRELESDTFEMSRSGQLQSNRIVDMENGKRLVEEMLQREVETRTKLESYVSKLEAQISDLNFKQVQMEEDREREHALLLQRLDEHMQAAGSTIEGKNKEFQELRVLYEGLKKQHAAAMEARTRLQADYTALEAERDALEEEVASLTAGFEHRGALITELEGKLTNFNPELQRLTRTLEQREQQIEQLDSELQELTGAFDSRGEKLAKVEDQLGKVQGLQDEVQRLKVDRDKLQKAVEVSISEVDSKERMLAEVEAALESLTAAYTNLQTEYTDLCADRNHMQNGLNEAQRTIKALKSQIME